MVTQLDEELGYDADHDDERQYCQHGTWIGSWWGPDYLCQFCEDGITKEQAELIRIDNAIHRAKHDGRIAVWINMADCMHKNPHKHPFSAMLATWMTNMLLQDAYQEEIQLHLKQLRRLQARRRLFVYRHPTVEAELEAKYS